MGVPFLLMVAMTQQNLNRDRDLLLQQAHAAVQKALTTGPSDPNRPKFHFHSPAHWMNDPNGPIYYRGWYHVFYQFNPYGDGWGNMHWGHARSRDMVHWEHLPIALWPSKPAGEDHVFSGSSFLGSDGKPVVFYTSIGGREPEQWLAHPDDDGLLRWTKDSANPVIAQKNHGDHKLEEWRDPFLFQEGGTTYLLTGGRDGGHGIVAAYRAAREDLTEWKYLGILFRHPTSDLIECPNIAKIGDRWILLTSHNGQVDWFSGSLDLASPKFQADLQGIAAPGSYASQLLCDRLGRLVHLAWVPTSDRKGWNGYLTLPSVLTLSREGALVRTPIRALESLRQNTRTLDGRTLREPLSLDVRDTRAEVELQSDLRQTDRLEIQMRLTDGSLETLLIDVKGGFVQLGTRHLKLANASSAGFRLFFDGSAFDFYSRDGLTTFCAPLRAGVKQLKLVSLGGPATLRRLRHHDLKPAETSLESFPHP